MRLYAQADQYPKQGNFNMGVHMGQHQKQYFLQNFIQENDNGKMMHSSLAKKRENFRQQIRRQYLKTYFEKKRIEMFGWQSNHSVFFSSQQQPDLGEIQINRDKDIYKQSQENQNHNDRINLKPVYPQDYFKDVILLEKLISTKDEYHTKQDQYLINDDDNFFQNSEQFLNKNCEQKQNPVFVYNSFYQFLIATIREHLNHRYFQNQRFMDQNNNNSKIFSEHFNAIKNMLYKKLHQQMQQFLLSIKNFNQSLNEKNIQWIHKILLQTYVRLVYQLTEFAKSENLLYSSSCEENKCSPIIPVQQQLEFLLNMLISITYFDQIQSTKQQDIQNIHQTQQAIFRFNPQRRSSISYHQQVVNKYLNEQQFNQQQGHNQHQQSLMVPMTRLLIQNTQLLDTLKFIIVFGVLDQNYFNKTYHQNEHSSSQHQNDKINFNNNKRRQHIISLMIVLLRNVSINIGSDLLFQNGIIAELKCVLKQPLFRVEIRKKKNKRGCQNMNKNKCQLQQQQNKFNTTAKPILHYRIQSFIIECFQMIRHQQSQQYLSKMNSFQFTFDILEHVYLETIKINKLFQSLPSGQQYLNQRDVGLCGDYNDDIGNDSDDCSDNDSQLEITQILKGYKLQKLNKFAQQCIQCLKFHFYLGEINNNSTLSKTREQNIFTIDKNNNKFSNKNRYVVKFNYIPNAEQVLMYFDVGRQLMGMITGYY